jgi:hypothetical protein
LDKLKKNVHRKIWYVPVQGQKELTAKIPQNHIPKEAGGFIWNKLMLAKNTFPETFSYLET